MDAKDSRAPEAKRSMTFPALKEARGTARALEATGLPYMVSFVVRPSARSDVG